MIRIWSSSINGADTSDVPLNDHYVRIITGKPSHADVGIATTAAAVPTHYAAEERISRALSRLGKPAAAQLIIDSLPQTGRIRSGDLGEIYATEWIDSHSGYKAPIKRLRWKDHRNMAMRGDDVVGLLLDSATQRLRFLKTESKSRIALRTQTLEEARVGLDKDGGLPSSHALAFVSARLLELGNDLPLVDAIDDALCRHGIPVESVKHLLFTFSGNTPQVLLTEAMQAYPGPISQWGVGLHVNGHAEFVGAVYAQVIANANNP